MYQKSHSLAALARSISDINNEWENPVQAPCPWSNLFISYILSENFFSLFRNTSLYLEKMASDLRNKGQLKPNALKENTSFVGLYKCCGLKYWQKIDQKWNTIYWLKTVYDDYIIKWPLKHRIVLSIEMLWQNCHWNGTAGELSSSDSLDGFLAPSYSRNSNYKR